MAVNSVQTKNKRPAAVPTTEKSKRVKSRAELNLEKLVFGAEDEDVGNDIFERFGQEAAAAGFDDDNINDDGSDQYASDSSKERNEGELEFQEETEKEKIEESLFFVDTARQGPSGEQEGEPKSEDKDGESTNDTGDEDDSRTDNAAWVDEDTQNARVALKGSTRTRKLREIERENMVNGDVYEERLRQQFQKINPTPKWAAAAESSAAWGSDEEDSEDRKESRIGDELLQTSKPLLSRSNALLPPSIIDIVRVRNGNQMAPSQSAVASVQFHPSANVMLTAGLDRTLRLFEVDGKDNHKVQSIYFKDLPVAKAQFIRSGQEVIVCGRRNWYYSVDVEKGAVTRINGIPGQPKLNSLEFMHGSFNGDRIAVMSNNGQIHLVSARTKQFIRTLPMNGAVRDVSFTADGNYLWSIGLDNEVYQWDLRQNRCLSRWHDQTVFRPACLEISQDTSYYACGDNSGIVNIYDVNSIKTQADADDSSGGFFNAKPFKTIGNLSTSINGLKFNHNSEILGIFSRKNPSQLRLVHLPTATVFSNWPSVSSHLGHVQCIDFSPNSGFMAVGNDKGKALLYRLPHFQNY
ncbi:U3 snoRNP protein [Coemansia spiralis]|uniref:U3 snoRNP protein n=2 Tax=Coemansia TaxID=4863 RepID=A0A9W8G5K0_9FUNG|nr:U3 snoRNP protein [Coemansia umbellata]KAJ2618687.1 U3 snoRNP protein [Coemansia sp. RSA 1358]KAJ2674178.1 U3 snoRNP protein [Coemansia spiralis]